MSINNNYSNYYKNYATAELKKIASKTETYQDEARLAAYQELENRGETFSELQRVDVRKLRNHFSESEKQKENTRIAEKKVIQDNEERELYSPNAIVGFSIFFSPFYGAILLAINFYKEKKRQIGINTLLFGALLSAMVFLIAVFFKANEWLAVGMNVLGGILLIEFFWKRIFNKELIFKRKSIWKIVFITIGIKMIISLATIFVVYFYFPELYFNIYPEEVRKPFSDLLNVFEKPIK